MMRFWLGAIDVLCLAAFVATSAHAQIDYNAIQIVTEKIGPNLYILSGSAGTDQNHQDAAGGRIGVLAGPDGILMVDSAVRPDQRKGAGGSSAHQHRADQSPGQYACPY